MRNPFAWFRERRSVESGPYSYVDAGNWWSGTRDGPESINVIRAENLATVQACVGVISSTIASLPARIYQVANGVRTEVEDNPFSNLIANPYAVQTWSDWCEFIMGNAILHGNALAQVVSDGTGVIRELRVLPWQYVTPLRLLRDPAEGRLIFNVKLPNVPMYQVLDSEVFFLRDRSDDGLIGRSRISRSPGAVRNAESLQNFSLASWDNQAKPSAFVTPGKSTSRDGFKRFKAQFDEKNTGTKNAGRVIYGDDGATYTAMQMSPEDAQVLESRRFGVEEICRLFTVPPPLVQDYTRNTFSNAATAGLWFAQFTLLPWVRKIEAEFKRSVFGLNGGYELELDMSGLTRGDYAARWASYMVARQQKILTTDEVRAQEGYGPMPTTIGHNGGPPLDPEQPGDLT